ncbi:LOW QUALITY PROTEIN: polyadenylate-binding protein RBP47B'-like [Argentina anserina]|uniref:LOW QUALITY PROTEIN: polyadenylate-binding protein RBP47B'-like n=1 Tax=Argentina anserina TaxID=57926 RepID=UPI0021763758|nr:LOW QUALITY PROTEIN: polyadenylate-binding protein RBP47B'-like [Potentilla anserina]
MMNPQPQPGPQGYPHHQPTSVEEVRTLWIGDLQYWVDENYLTSCFAHTGEVISIKIIRNKMTGQPEGYGFVEFVSHAAAERILHAYNGTQMPGTEQTFRLNWASFGIGERRPDAGPEHSIFVGDLAPDVTDFVLQETFHNTYPSVRGAKVVTDANTGRSKGYGFVKFADEAERNRAMTEMDGVYCSTRPMRISAATPKKTTGFQQQYVAAKAVYPVPAYTTPAVPVVPAAEYDANNTTVNFVGNLDPNIAEEELKQTFLQFGDIVYVKTPAGKAKGCGFVQFGTRSSAEEAIQRMQGKMIGQQVVRISWGRSPTTKQDVPGSWGQQVDPSQWNAYYGYGQGYDPYGYGATQDPSLYAYNGYAGYGQYPQQVDGVQDMGAMAGTVPSFEQRDELDDSLATPDVDKLNAAYLAVHGRAILGHPMWLRTSVFPQQA